MLRAGLPEQEYDDRLQFFNLEKLELRRIHYDLVMLYKIIHGYCCTSLRDCIHFAPNMHNTRGHSLKLNVMSTRTNVLKYYFINCNVPLWNALPETTVTSNVIKGFKRRISVDRPQETDYKPWSMHVFIYIYCICTINIIQSFIQALKDSKLVPVSIMNRLFIYCSAAADKAY